MSYDELDDSVKLETPPPKDTGALAIRTSIDRIEGAMSEFDRISAGLEDLARRFPPDLVYDVSTTKGMNEAIAHRAAWRDPRINVEKFRKAAKAPVLALGKDIDARATWLTEQLLLGETPVHEQIKAEEARKEAERQAKINAEFGRVQAIQEAIADIHMAAMAAMSKSSAAISDAIDKMKAETLTEAVFQEQLAQAQAAQRAAIDKLELAYKAKLHDEEEAAKVAAERAELAALRKAAAEQKAKDEAAAAERQAAERRAAEAEQARLNAEAAVARAEADRIAAAERAKAQAEHEAAMKAEREAAAEARRIAEEQALTELAKKHAAEKADAKMRAAAPLMLAALYEALEFAEDYEDVLDGPNGEQVPNKAMLLAQSLRAAIAAAVAQGEGVAA